VLRYLTERQSSRFLPAKKPSKLVAVVVPVSRQPEVTPDDEVSLRHLRKFLGRYDKFVIAPEGSNFELNGFQTEYFSREFFGSPKAHGRMLYRQEFYKRFEDYKYILMHHLDALVFSDQLEEWCGTDVDFIGAPWIPHPDDPRITIPQVGNGGFALMKVESILTVLHQRYLREPSRYWQDRFPRFFKVLPSVMRYPWRLIPRSIRHRKMDNIRKEFQTVEVTVRSNDRFWSNQAAKYMPEFNIPDWQTGLRFAFEHRPWHCLELNDQKLPFGCHAWPKYRSFWEPYLLK
jgi:hypothetical protein